MLDRIKPSYRSDKQYSYCHRQRSEDEARDTFKTLKSQLIGDNFAHLYSEWALLENQAGITDQSCSRYAHCDHM